jgi:hypothetical protein
MLAEYIFRSGVPSSNLYHVALNVLSIIHTSTVRQMRDIPSTMFWAAERMFGMIYCWYFFVLMLRFRPCWQVVL